MSSDDDRRSGADRRGGADRRSSGGRRSGADRRTEVRTKKRVRCEVLAAGVQQRGFVLDVSPKGLFVQTPKPIDPGVEISVEVSPPGAETIELRAMVARSRRVPAKLASVASPGVGLRITLAPPEWYEFVAGLTSSAPRESSASPAKPTAPRTPREPAVPEEPSAPEKPPAPKKRKRKLPPRMPPPESRSHYRVQAKHTGGPRSRSLVVNATSREDAESLALEELGSDWKIIDVEGV